MTLLVLQETRIIRLLCSMVPFAIINSFMLNVALPDIAKQFSISPSLTSWVVTVSGIISALGALIYGKLADHFGIKSLAVFGVLLFSVGSIFCLMAPDFPLLIVGRVIQGIGVSAIPTLAMIVPVRYVDEERRGKAPGTLASVMALSGVIGPIMGGIFTGILHWRFLFLFSTFIILTLPFILKWFPNDVQKKAGKVNLLGAGLLTAFIICLMEAITLLNIWLFIGSICLLILFLIQQRKSINPFIPIHLFQNAAYRYGIIMGAVNTSANFGVFLITPLLFSQFYGLNGFWIGLLLAPSAITSGLLGSYGGALSDREGSRYVVRLSLLLLSIGFLLLSTLSGYTYWVLSLCLILTEIGYVFMQPSLTNWISRKLSVEQSGIGLGVYSLSNFISIAICGAITTKLIELNHFPLINPAAIDSQTAIYSNIYFGFFILAMLSWLFVTFYVKDENGRLLQKNNERI